MELLNLTLGQLLAILLPLSGMVIALYFYDRTRKRQTVSALRFWPRRPPPPQTTRRKKLQQPLSLLLQLLALILLILAIADWRIGSSAENPRHHVVILETSSWMNAATAGGTLMDTARQRAESYLRAVPSGEFVMLIRADDVPAPATVFTADRAVLRQAIRESQPGATACNLAAAIDLAKSSLRLATGLVDESAPLSTSRGAGEIVYVGSGRVSEAVRGHVRTDDIPAFRVIESDAALSEAGIRRLSARRSAEDSRTWEVVADVHNYGTEPQNIRADFFFNNQKLGGRSLSLAANGDEEIHFTVKTERAGNLRAEINANDAIASNNATAIDLPALLPQSISVYSTAPAGLRKLFDANPQLAPVYRQPSEYASNDHSSLVIFQGFAPPSSPSHDAIYLAPPAGSSPVEVTTTASNVRVTQWSTSHPISAGLRSRDFEISRTLIFKSSPDDVVVAESDRGPVAVARSVNGRREVVFGFDLGDSRLERKLATPLLFANTVRWFAADLFKTTELSSRPPGLVEMPLSGETAEEIAVAAPGNSGLTWFVRGDRLRLYAGRPGAVTVRTPYTDARFDLTLPELGEARWTPPEGALKGIPPPAAASAPTRIALWPLFAIAAAILLGVDWNLYGRKSPAGAYFAEASVNPNIPGVPQFPMAAQTRADLRRREVAR